MIFSTITNVNKKDVPVTLLTFFIKGNWRQMGQSNKLIALNLKLVHFKD